MFEQQSSVPDAMLPWRSTVIAFKQPRRTLVQPVTRSEGDDVVLQVDAFLFICCASACESNYCFLFCFVFPVLFCLGVQQICDCPSSD
jgi:hypothetical protein